MTVVKISILFFYKRIFSTAKFQIVAWIAIAIVAAWGVIFFFVGQEVDVEDRALIPIACLVRKRSCLGVLDRRRHLAI